MVNKLTFAEICEIIEEETRNAEKVKEESGDLLDEILAYLEEVEKTGNIPFHQWFCSISSRSGYIKVSGSEVHIRKYFKSFNCGTEEKAMGVERLFLALGMSGKNKKRKSQEHSSVCKYVYFYRMN